MRLSLPADRNVPLLALLAGSVAALLGLVGYALVSATRVYSASGEQYPGAVTAVAEPVGYFIATLAGCICFGGLLYVIVVACPDADGVIDEGAFRVHLVTEYLSVVWAASAIVMVAIQAASSAGVSVTELVGSGAMVDAIEVSETSRAWVAVALGAVVVAVCVRLSVRWVNHVVLLPPALIGVVALPVSGNAGQGPDHDYATSAAIVVAVAVAALTGAKAAAVIAPPAASLARRVLAFEIVCGAVALGYGASLLWILTGPGDLTGTGFGRAGAAAALMLGVVWLVDVASLASARRRAMPESGTRDVLAALAMIAVVALIASMATQTAPRLLSHRFTTWDVFLGYALPNPPSVLTMLTVWRFDGFIAVGALVLALGYVLGYLRLRRRGDGWPVGRLVAWVAGCLTLLFVSSSGVKAYGSAMFSVHMADHMTMNMFIPVLLVLGGPVTLALRALIPAGHDQPPGPREWLLWLVHSKATAFLAHPVTAFVLFVGSVYVVYFTPLFNTLVRYHWGHELMSMHFLLVGYLFFWGIIGIDPGPRKLPFLGRLGLLFAVMPFHAFFGIATMTMTSVIGGQFYRYVGLPWLPSLQGDQHLGGAIAWGTSELPVVLVVVALVAQWAREDRRVASRSDRHADSGYADDDLDAYNAMLRELSRNRRT
ncbi:MAG: cytochrome c oxidase assembly protein [Actinomycetota bacterium]|uniref:Cytochrome c oxidase assembly protein n=2 Tax=Mycobacterium lentiflavum TaxID=141349 RepID=A0ABY3V033_MYCLN|nr:cytochrome c oxidase assembly protein [Mycobacterium lentiflavum]MEE3062900.1 cytochrome c oxidase assembly protein [Actinomycetota bacterium]ULP45183.1 cytochrome c oxidase assembly protein [Mycobacterium lentiflavum]